LSEDERFVHYSTGENVETGMWGLRNVTLSEAKGLKITEGICEGEIIPEERGTGGFGYDPIFLLPELGKTMAELSMDEKNRISHRARAVMNTKGILKELISK